MIRGASTFIARKRIAVTLPALVLADKEAEVIQLVLYD
jgi:hypothetical protein